MKSKRMAKEEKESYVNKYIIYRRKSFLKQVCYVATIIEIVDGLLGLGGCSAAIIAVINSAEHCLNDKDRYVEARTYEKNMNKYKIQKGQ